MSVIDYARPSEPLPRLLRVIVTIDTDYANQVQQRETIPVANTLTSGAARYALEDAMTRLITLYASQYGPVTYKLLLERLNKQADAAVLLRTRIHHAVTHEEKSA